MSFSGFFSHTADKLTLLPGYLMSENIARFYDFGEFRLDTEERQLLKNGTPVPITFRAYEVLHVLVTNSGRIMEKDALMDLVWGDTIVEEGNLKNLVYGLRKALGDDTANSSYIQTLPKRGYRFVAEVKEVPAGGLVIEHLQQTEITIDEEIEVIEDPVPVVAPQPLALPAAQPSIFRFWPALLLLVAAIGAGGFYFLKVRAARPALSLDTATVSPMTFGANAMYPVISPDGKFTAYIAEDAKGRTLSVRQMATNSTLKLMELDGKPWDIEFSGDSNFIYIVVGGGQYPKGVLYQIPTLGGQAKKLIEHIGSTSIAAKDGRIAFLRDQRLLIAGTNGKDEQEILEPRAKLGGVFQSFAWNPEATGFIASIARAGEGTEVYWQIVEFGADGSGLKEIGGRLTRPTSITPMADGAGLIALQMDDDALVSKLIYYNRTGSDAPRELTKDTNFYNLVSITADGRTVLAGRMSRPTDLWISETGAGADDAVKIATGYFNKVNWGANDSIVLDAIENGRSGIWSYDTAGGSRQQLTGDLKRNDYPALSPDRKHIYYTASDGARAQLWRMGADGNDARQITDLAFGVHQPAVSPNGDGVYFSGFTAGKWSIYKVGPDGGEPAIALPERADAFAISPDGARIAYLAYSEEQKKDKIFIHDTLANKRTSEFDLPKDAYWTMKWSPDGRAIEYLAHQDETTGCIYSQSIDGGEPKPLTCLKNEMFVSFARNPENKKLAFTSCHYVFDAVLFKVD